MYLIPINIPYHEECSHLCKLCISSQIILALKIELQLVALLFCTFIQTLPIFKKKKSTVSFLKVI